jgi:hypothetical protein
MSLNKFSNTTIGQTIDLQIGCDELKANNVVSDNLDVSTINGSPYPPSGGGVSNPLTADLKLDGYRILEEIASLSPSLVVEQEDPAKNLQLKVGGLNALQIDSLEVKSSLPLNLNGNDAQNGGNIQSNSVETAEIKDSTTGDNTIILQDGASFDTLNIKSDGKGVIIQEITSGNNIGIQSVASGFVAKVGNLNIRNEDASGNISINNINGGDILYSSANGHQFTGNNYEVNCSVDNHTCDINMNTNRIYGVGQQILVEDNLRIENTNNGFSLRNSRDAPLDNIFIAKTSTCRIMLI